MHRGFFGLRDPFRYTAVQGLKPDDCQKRVTFDEWLLQQQNTDNVFIAHILWTDEACFTRDGVFNHHNRDRLLGPNLLPERLSRQSYLVFLNEVLTELKPLAAIQAIKGLRFQYDGDPTHFWAPVRDWLDIAYPGSWIGRQGPILGPPTFARSYTVGIFPMGPSQGTGTSKHSDNTNGLSCSSACCMYFGGPRSAATWDDSHSSACSSLPRHARQTL
ncbi:DUF4817 domain-containing protein [Trichonephila clavipes]|uniref:DUF4817 domain-containing protein n=1 Tax=Trichonephila clavipes TaxID=2585209 RepID=A0A8X6S8F1_TRICX|nr:DUF4817 domain-containing protein [Trichonephila clavipes]